MTYIMVVADVVDNTRLTSKSRCVDLNSMVGDVVLSIISWSSATVFPSMMDRWENNTPILYNPHRNQRWFCGFFIRMMSAVISGRGKVDRVLRLTVRHGYVAS